MSDGFTIGELAREFELACRGDAQARVDGVCTLSPGIAGRLSFLANPRYKSALADTRASAVVLSAADADGWQGNALIADDPYLAFARIANHLHPEANAAPGIHASAVIADSARVDDSATICAGVVIDEGAVVGAHCRIGARCVIGSHAVLGDACRLHPGVVLEPQVRIGRRVRINSGAIIGGRGFGLAMGPLGWEEVPQLGSVVIGDDVEIGANTTIDRGAMEDTRIGNGVKIDNQVQVAHNVQIGDHTAIAGCTAIAGSSRIGSRCMIGGGSAISGHLHVTDGVVVLGFSMVSRSITKPGYYGSGFPVDEAREYRKNVARVRRLGKLEERVRSLESTRRGDAGND